MFCLNPYCLQRVFTALIWVDFVLHFISEVHLEMPVKLFYGTYLHILCFAVHSIISRIINRSKCGFYLLYSNDKHLWIWKPCCTHSLLFFLFFIFHWTDNRHQHLSSGFIVNKQKLSWGILTQFKARKKRSFFFTQKLKRKRNYYYEHICISQTFCLSVLQKQMKLTCWQSEWRICIWEAHYC